MNIISKWHFNLIPIIRKLAKYWDGCSIRSTESFGRRNFLWSRSMSIWQPSLTFGSNGKKREMHLKTAVSRRTTKKLKNERKSAASRDNRWWRAMSSEIKRRKKGRVAGLVHPQRKTNKTRGNRTKSSEQPATQAAATTATACVLMRPWWSSSISEPGRSIFLHRPTSFFFLRFALSIRFEKWMRPVPLPQASTWAHHIAAHFGLFLGSAD